MAAQSVASTETTSLPHRGGSRGVDGGRVETFQVTIAELQRRTRTVRVYLPPGYTDAGPRLPVLYLQDGQSLFSAGPYGDWHVDETFDRMIASGALDPMIVVGVDNGPQRWSEYGPWVQTHMHAWIDTTWAAKVEGGEGDAYLRFLIGALKPEIDRRYRTLPDRAHTAIGGSSMGGLISVYAGLTHPEIFSKVMAMSTAVWFAEDGGPFLSHNRLLDFISAHGVPSDVRFYLDVGTAERSRDTEPNVLDALGNPVRYPTAYVEGTRRLAAALVQQVPASHVRLVVEDSAIHHESAWARRLPSALAWLFRGGLAPP